MSSASPRLAVRALILHAERLLLVNAYPDAASDLWCAPGGGVAAGTSLPDNLRREIREETGLAIAVGAPALVNEFHEPGGAFHQVEVFFHARIEGGDLDPSWHDPAGVVSRRRFVGRDELAAMRYKPDALPAAAWGGGPSYDALEPLQR